MTHSNDIVTLVARILLGAMFLLAGLMKTADVSGFAAYMASGGIPAVLAWPAILFEILAGAAVILGFQTRIAGLLLAGFCLVTAMLYHFDPTNQIQMTMMFKNIALAGGYLALSVLGAGRYSLDARVGGAAATA